ncbi:MAG: DUF2029 domain-containing protein [Chloroflexi bacterium]|nr:DUF2029 domain-containing protein [Chloroflexota bacterium]
MNWTLVRRMFMILGIALLIFLYFSLQWGSLDAFAQAFDSCKYIFCDFLRYYYPMGKQILTEHKPSEGFYYSPTIALVFSLWRFQERETAILTWGVVQILAIILLLATWHHSRQKVSFPFRLLFLFLTLTAMPVIHNFKWGQISLLINLSIILALELYEANQKAAAAFWLAFSTLFKFYPILFLFYFLFTGDLIFIVLFMFLLFVLGIAIPAMFIGFKPTIIFYFAVLDVTGARFADMADRLPGINSQYFPLVAMRYFGEFNNLEWLPPLQILSWLILGANLLLVMLLASSNLENRNRWAFLILLASTSLLIPSSWPHYFIYLPASQASLLFLIARDKHRIWKYPILLVSMVFSNVLFVHTFESWQPYAYWGFLACSNLLLILLTYAETIPQLSLRGSYDFYRNYFRSVLGQVQEIRQKIISIRTSGGGSNGS